MQKLADAADTDANLMPYILDCVEAYATLGEIADILRNKFGEYQG
jgi:methylmalonyl-CoA mutase N-terminal domain/subunit